MSLIKTALIDFDINFITNNINLIVKIIVTPITMCIKFIVMKNLIEKIKRGESQYEKDKSKCYRSSL